MSRFQGKTAVVTGASGGIGAAMAKRFAAEGAAVVVSAIEPRVEEVAEQLRRSWRPGGCAAHGRHRQGGWSRRSDDLAESEFGRVDISVQNAGVITIARIEAMTEAEWDKVMAVNTKGVFLCCQEAIAPHAQAWRRRPADQHRLRPGPAGLHLHAALCGRKFGVVGITQSLAKEVAKEGITVNAICPGIIDTDMWAYNDAAWGKLLGDYKPGELMAEWVKNIPMGRAGTGDDVSGLVAFLASEDAAYITGQTINVDGGLIMS